MNFNDNITFDTYIDDANKQFSDVNYRLSDIEKRFQTRMDGKTMRSLGNSIFGTLMWFAIFVAGAIYVRNMANRTMFLTTAMIVLGLILFMIIDSIIDCSYYGKISSYKNSILKLKNRINAGRNSIKANYAAFTKARSNGWNYDLNFTSSILDEAMSVERTMMKTESLKKEFVSKAKNFFYYAATIAITIFLTSLIFPTGSKIITFITQKSFEDSTLLAFNTVALIITIILEVIFSKSAWSATDCEVTNTTLFILLLGPIIFLTIIAVVTLVVMLFVLLGKLIAIVVPALLKIILAIVVGGIVLASTSG